MGRLDVAAGLLYAEAVASGDSAHWRALAERLKAQGNRVMLQDALQQLLSYTPSDDWARYELAVLLVTEDPEAAYVQLAELLASPEYGGRAAQLLAAIDEATAAGAVMRYFRIGQALASQERWAQAEEAFAVAVALAPDFAQAWAYSALCRAQQGKSAGVAVARALERGGNDPLVAFLVGLTWRADGDVEHAIQLLSLAVEREPTNPAFAVELGQTLRLAGDLPAAEYWLKTAVALGSDDPAFLKVLALFYADEGYNLVGEGLTVLREAAARFPGDPAIQAAYGWGLYQSGDMDGAREAVDLALALDPSSPRAVYYHGMLAWADEDLATARADFLRVVGLSDAGDFGVLAKRGLERMGDA